MARSDTVTVCAIVRDECAYLVEWVAYYRLLGFDRLILYNNESSDGTGALLDRMQAAGLVEHRPWADIPNRSAQLKAYADAVGRCDTRWILFVDADEFLHLVVDRDIHGLLARMADDVSAIAFSWRLFGSSGLVDQRPEPVIERFTRASPPDHHLNRHVKTMAVAADVAVAGVHGVHLARGRYVNPNGREIALKRDAFMTPAPRTARINHYVVKSLAEFRQKQKRGDANRTPEDPQKVSCRTDEFFTYHDHNEVEERDIQRRLPALRREIARVSRAIGEEAPPLRLSDRLRLDRLRPRWPRRATPPLESGA